MWTVSVTVTGESDSVGVDSVSNDDSGSAGLDSVSDSDRRQ